MPDMRRAHRDLVVGLRMAEIDHFVDRQKPSVERSWARAFWPHTHTLALKCPATGDTERLRFRFDEQELASGAALMRVRDAIAAARLAQSAAPPRALRLYSRREIINRDAWLPSNHFLGVCIASASTQVLRFKAHWRRAEVDRASAIAAPDQ